MRQGRHAEREERAWPLVALLLLAGLSGACGQPSASREAGRLRVYAAVDRLTAEPILDEFRRQRGIAVEVVYDTETAKTVALTHRLERERDEPRADVWWSGEAFYTTVLEQRGLLEPLEGELGELAAQRRPFSGRTWVGAALRLRVLVHDPARWPNEIPPPASVRALADPRLRGRVAMARPTAGTSATHAAWLASRDEGRALLRAIGENGIILVPGNAHVVQAVARGQVLLGLTDSDDVLVARARSPGLALTVPDQGAAETGCVATPASAAVVARAGNPRHARELVAFLASPEVERMLAESPAEHLPLATNVPSPGSLPRLDALKLAPVDLSALAPSWEKLRGEALKLLEP